MNPKMRFLALLSVSSVLSRKIHVPLPEYLPETGEMMPPPPPTEIIELQTIGIMPVLETPTPTMIIEPRPDELIVTCVKLEKEDMRWVNGGKFEVQVWWDDGQVKGWQTQGGEIKCEQ